MSKISAIQLNSTNYIEDNLKVIDYQLKIAKNQGAELVLLPENCVYMGEARGQSKAIAEPLSEGGKVMNAFSELAYKNDVWLIVGSFPTIENNTTYQTLLAYNNQGECISHYHKRHLFDVTLPDESESYCESDIFSHGSEVKVVHTPMGEIGFAICYDLRFPEHFRQLVDKGAELLLLPAAFTYATGKAHWEILLRARAIENQCYILAAAQVGKHPGNRETWGHSMLVNPWGAIIDSLANGQGVVMGEWDKNLLQHQRKIFPALLHRRS